MFPAMCWCIAALRSALSAFGMHRFLSIRRDEVLIVIVATSRLPNIFKGLMMITSYRVAILLMVVFGSVGIMAARHDAADKADDMNRIDVSSQNVEVMRITPQGNGEQPVMRSGGSDINGSIDRIAAQGNARTR